MNAINELFSRKKGDILSIYFTAGFPQRDDTNDIIRALADNGADMIEIGIPYSDPVADGPVIEQSSARAIRNGMTIHLLFDQLRSLKLTKKIPLLLMGYLNPVLQYGYEKFCTDAASAGISGLIIPDLPAREFKAELQPFTKKNHLEFIFLITPETSEERIREIDRLSEGFIYAVSSSSITGRDTDNHKKEEYLERLRSYRLKNPLMVGFGIKDNDTFRQATKYTAGAIIGTAFIRRIEREENFDAAVKQFINTVEGKG